MKNIYELIKETKTNMNGNSINLVENYYNSSDYLYDAISEFADNNTSVYHSNIIRFISENVEKVSDTIDEFGWDGCGSDLYKAGQMAEFHTIELEMYEDEDNIKILALLLLMKDEGITEIDETTFDNWCNEISTADRFDEIADTLQDLILDFTYSCEEHEEDETKLVRGATA